MSASRTGSASPSRRWGVTGVLGVVLSVSRAGCLGTRLRRMVVMTGPPDAGRLSGSCWVPSGTADLPPPAEGLGTELASPLTLRASHRPFAARGRAARGLSGILGMAVRHGRLPANPVAEAGAQRTPRSSPGPRALTLDESLRLLTLLAADPIAVRHDLPDLVEFLLGTGLRISEACAVQPGDVDLAVGTLTVTGTVIPRTLPWPAPRPDRRTPQPPQPDPGCLPRPRHRQRARRAHDRLLAERRAHSTAGRAGGSRAGT